LLREKEEGDSRFYLGKLKKPKRQKERKRIWGAYDTIDQ